MSATRVVASVVQAALPDDYRVHEGALEAHQVAGEQSVAVFPMGGRQETWGLSRRLPELVHDRVRLRLRAPSDSNTAWLHAMGDRLRRIVLQVSGTRAVVDRLYFGSNAFADDVNQTWADLIIVTDQAARFNTGRKWTTCDIDFAVTMQPAPVRPLRTPWAWRGSPFLVYEAGSGAAAVEVQRTAVASGRVLVGGRITCRNPMPATNPPDDPFPAGAPQGGFPGAAAGAVLWRDTSVGTETTGTGGSREVNLFTGSLDDVPRRAGGGTVLLRKVVLNANDGVSFVTSGRFEPELEQTGIFFWRIAGADTVYTFPLAGAPVVRVGDNHYDVTPPPVEGFRTAIAEMATLGDWAFADGRQWRTEPWESQPPAAGRWRATWTLSDGVGNELHSQPILFGETSDRELTARVHPPIAVTDHGGELVQTLTLRDESTPPVNDRGRYTVRVTLDGLVVHGEDATTPAPDSGDEGFDVGYVDEGYGA